MYRNMCNYIPAIRWSEIYFSKKYLQTAVLQLNQQLQKPSKLYVVGTFYFLAEVKHFFQILIFTVELKF